MLKKRIKRLYSYRRALWDLSLKNLKTKYAGSKLGIWWAVAAPLILAISINFIFNAVFKIQIANYTLFVLAGIIPWLFSTNALMEATVSFNLNVSLLKQGVFPRELIPFSSILANLLNFLIGFIFLLPLFVIYNLRVIKFLPFLLLAIILHFVFIIGLGILFSFMNVFSRDTVHFLSIAFMVWFWITPVFYSFDMIPISFRWICLLNPMTHYVILYQNALFHTVPFSFISILIPLLISLSFFSLGYSVFLKGEIALLKRI